MTHIRINDGLIQVTNIIEDSQPRMPNNNAFIKAVNILEGLMAGSIFLRYNNTHKKEITDIPSVMIYAYCGYVLSVRNALYVKSKVNIVVTTPI